MASRSSSRRINTHVEVWPPTRAASFAVPSRSPHGQIASDAAVDRIVQHLTVGTPDRAPARSGILVRSWARGNRRNSDTTNTSAPGGRPSMARASKANSVSRGRVPSTLTWSYRRGWLLDLPRSRRPRRAYEVQVLDAQRDQLHRRPVYARNQDGRRMLRGGRERLDLGNGCGRVAWVACSSRFSGVRAGLDSLVAPSPQRPGGPRGHRRRS